MVRMEYVAKCLFIMCAMGICFANMPQQDEALDARIQYAMRNMDKTMALVQMHKPDDDGNCRYKCPDGSERRPKPGHMPSKNGCISPKTMKIDMLYMPKMGKCCDAHDLCYDTCMTIKEECDELLKGCLYSMCVGWKVNKKKKTSQKKNEDSHENLNVEEGNKKTIQDKANENKVVQDKDSENKVVQDKANENKVVQDKDNENKVNEKTESVPSEEEEITDIELEIRRKWPNMHAGCRESAETMLRHTTVLGCREYRVSQKEACRCGYRPQSEGGGLLSEPIPQNTTDEIITTGKGSSVEKDVAGKLKSAEYKIKEQKPPKKDDKAKSKLKSTQNNETNKKCGSDTCSAGSSKSKSQKTDSNRKEDASRKSKEEL